MAQQALPERGARLGRPMGAAAARRTVHGVVLLLPSGEPSGTRRPSRLSVAAVLPLARRLVRAGRD
ncbi:alpha/beta hydrolase, partial [Streptomyces milbemycinicus]